MSGHIRQRGKKGQWYAVIDVMTDGKRKRVWHRLPGATGKREAEKACAALITKQAEGAYVTPAKLTVADLVRSRIDQWEAAGEITARSVEGYRRYLANQIAPHIGDKPVQKLAPLDIEAWHTALRNGGLAARTIGHAHRLLGKALRDAERHGLVVRNVARTQRAPRVSESEKAVVEDIPGLISALRERFYAPAMIGLFTGMRLSEILALRWNRVHLDRGLIEVRKALEQTKKFGIQFKDPKSKAGNRDITLPDILIDALREHRRSQLELRMQLGLGRPPDDALLFSDIEGNPLAPTPCRPGSASSPPASGCRGLGGTRCGIPTPRSSSPAASIS
jgi:integrase